MEEGMDERFSAGAMALASWALLHVLLEHLRETGVLTDQGRRDLVERALTALEEPRPEGRELSLTLDARRLLEDWL
jgi:hypothetical protein